VWLDRWRDVFVARLRPEHAQLGLAWYLRRHSPIDLVLKIGKGAGEIVGVFIYTAGVAFWNPVARVVTGIGTVGLAALGLRRRSCCGRIPGPSTRWSRAGAKRPNGCRARSRPASGSPFRT